MTVVFVLVKSDSYDRAEVLGVYATTESVAMPDRVVCPVCRAAPGQPCTELHRGRPRRLAVPHDARLLALLSGEVDGGPGGRAGGAGDGPGG